MSPPSRPAASCWNSVSRRTSSTATRRRPGNWRESANAVWAPEHLVTVWARDALARGLLRSGRGAEAEQLFRRVLDGQRAGYGDDHPLVYGVLIQLSRAQFAQGKREQAAESAREVAEGRAVILGEDHPETVAARAWHTEVLATPTAPDDLVG
ncbi:tetratricopeptide repeat protein [Streptomyces sp. SAI-129]|uniref:tetratricopeptide repeat protein n=1 Tax=Streptomyces sp. SAI-129 TaxID=3377727 RepID=UPI003C7D1609